MKIHEILVEFDNTSQYGNEVQDELVNYLASIKATGVTEPISTKKISQYMRSIGFDVLPEQITDILSGTSFDVAGSEISAAPPETSGPANMQANKVSQMASKQLKTGMK